MLNSQSLPARLTEDEFEIRVLEVFRGHFGESLRTVATVATCEDHRGVSQDVRLIHEPQRMDSGTKPVGSMNELSGTTGPELRHKPTDAEHY